MLYNNDIHVSADLLLGFTKTTVCSARWWRDFSGGEIISGVRGQLG
jgi:hypothetical protein